MKAIQTRDDDDDDDDDVRIIILYQTSRDSSTVCTWYMEVELFVSVPNNSRQFNSVYLAHGGRTVCFCTKQVETAQQCVPGTWRSNGLFLYQTSRDSSTVCTWYTKVELFDISGPSWIPCERARDIRGTVRDRLPHPLRSTPPRPCPRWSACRVTPPPGSRWCTRLRPRAATCSLPSGSRSSRGWKARLWRSRGSTTFAT